MADPEPEPEPEPDPGPPDPVPDPGPPLPDPQPEPRPDRWRVSVYIVDVYRQDDQETPLQRLGFPDRLSLVMGFRQIAGYHAPYRNSVPAGITVYDTVRDTWVDPHTDVPQDELSITWFDIQVKVGHGNY